MKNHQLFSMIQGEGTPILMLHGLTASHHDWDWLAPQLVQAGYKVYIPDLPGHGDSPEFPTPITYTMDNLYASLLEWMDQVTQPAPFFLVSHSLGGYLSLKYALDHPSNVLGMALVAPLFSLRQIYPVARRALRYPSLSEKAIRLARPGLVHNVIRLASPILGKYPDEAGWQTAVDYSRAAPESMRFPASTTDLTPRLREISTPAYIFWGAYDLMLRTSLFPELARNLQNARVHAFPACGHEPHLARIPEINELIIQFFQEITHGRNFNPA
jgi:pimeloyl-ACP methyl ester carboxylesterase